MRPSPATVLLLAATTIAPLPGCADGPAGPDPVVVQGALAACMDGDPDGGLATLSGALDAAPDWPDALAVRGLCRWTRYAADSSRADLDGAWGDLTAAIDGHDAWAGPAPVLSLDRLYNHRAFAAQARGDGWDTVLADLDRARDLAPDDPGHRFDRGAARFQAGDATGARADLDAFLAVADSSDAERRAIAARLLAELDAASA